MSHVKMGNWKGVKVSMSKVTILVCDKCEGQQGVTHYEVKVGTKRSVVDLCDEHKAPLEELLKAAPRTAKKAAPGRPRGRKVTSMEEIDKMKS